MSENKLFSTALREWTGIFVQRSMIDFKNFMNESGLSPSQVNTLMHIYYKGACSITAISQHVGITNPAASQMVDKLVQMDLIDRTEGKHDRRARLINLSPQGRTLIERGIKVRFDWLDEIAGELTPEQQEEATRVLTLMTAIVNRNQEHHHHCPKEN